MIIYSALLITTLMVLKRMTNRYGGKKLAWRFALCMVIIFSPLYYEFPNPPTSAVVSFAPDGRSKVQPFGKFSLEWGSYSNMPLKGAEVRSGILGCAQANRVTYVLQAKIFDPTLYYRIESRRRHLSCSDVAYYDSSTKLEDSTAVESGIARATLYACYEFNSSHLAELQNGFNNPLEPSQNQRFRELLEPTLNEMLAKDGIRIEFKRFMMD